MLPSGSDMRTTTDGLPRPQTTTRVLGGINEWSITTLKSIMTQTTNAVTSGLCVTTPKKLPESRVSSKGDFPVRRKTILATGTREPGPTVPEEPESFQAQRPGTPFTGAYDEDDLDEDLFDDAPEVKRNFKNM